MKDNAPLRIAIAGLGTVGCGVVNIIQNHKDLIARRAGRPVSITAVSARDRGKSRGVDLSGIAWVDDPLRLPAMKEIDAIVEVIGGEGVAKSLTQSALQSGKHVVTANKALLASQGGSLAALAEKNGAGLWFEAAVAGGIPIIKSLREGFAGNNTGAVYGILNGTCNYILTEMRETGRDFEAVLKEAQEKGYAEADPSFDIDGIDAAHKLSLLGAIAFGAAPDFPSVDVSGMRAVTSRDSEFAAALGYKIKLVAIARKVSDAVEQSVEPCLVPTNSALGGVEGVFNAVMTDNDFAGVAMATGRGAGAGPTASAVLSDIIDIARGASIPAFGVPVQDLKKFPAMRAEAVTSEYCMHLIVYDRPGVIADVAAILRDDLISIESMIQRGRDPGQPVSVVLTTHECSRAAIRAAAAKIGALSSVTAVPSVFRVLGKKDKTA